MKLQARSAFVVFALLLGAITVPAQSAAGGNKPKLGVRIRGVVVEDVDASSVAARAGIRDGDVIINWSGHEIADIDDLRNQLQRLKGGAKSGVTLVRGGKNVQVQCAFPKELAGNGPRLGVAPVFGVRVEQVFDDSVAAKAGLEAGDVLQSMGGRELEGYQDLVARLARIRPGERRPMSIWRGGEHKHVELAFGEANGDRRAAGGGVVPTPRGAPRRADIPSGRPRRGDGPDMRGGGMSFEALAGPLRAFGELGAVSRDLRAAMDHLKKHADNEHVAKAMAHIEKAHKAIAQASQTVDGLKNQFDGLVKGFENWSGMSVDDVFSDGDPIKNLEQRIEELIKRDLDLDKILEIIRKEFPDADIEVERDAPKKSAPARRR